MCGKRCIRVIGTKGGVGMWRKSVRSRVERMTIPTGIMTEVHIRLQSTRRLPEIATSCVETT